MSKTYAIAHQKRLVAGWQQTCQTKSAFARSQGIVPNTFWTWTRKYGGPQTAAQDTPTEVSVTAAATPAFVEIMPVPKEVSLTVRVSVPGQPLCELDFVALRPPVWFAAVLREVAAC
jgi:hypothetical protein